MKRMVVFLMCSLLIVYPIFANTGTIEGTVIDLETGSPLPGANIIVQKTTLGAAADMSGEYVIQNVPSGQYAIRVQMIGYQVGIASNISVESGRATQVQFALKEKAINTEAVEVNGSYFDNYSDAVISTHTLTARDILASPGSAEDVFRSLKNIPGVGTTGSRSANLIVRGGDRNENLTLLDNIEIKSPLHFSREDMSMGVISIIDPDLIKNVEFLTGGFPAEYGDKLSSVFELKIKDGNRTQFNHDINLSMAGFSGYLDGPLPGNGSMVLSLRRGIFDLFTKMMNRNVQPRYWDTVGKITYPLGTKHQLSLVGFYYRDDAERNQKMDDHGDLARRYEYMKWEDLGSAMGINWRYLFSKKGYALTTLEWTSNGSQSQIGSFANKDSNGDDITTHNLQFKTKISYKVSPHLTIKTGGYYKQITSEFYRWREPDTLKTGFIIPEYRQNTDLPDSYLQGAFLQATLQPVKRFMILPGIRYESYDLTNESYTSPRLALAWQLNHKTTLNASWGVFRQTPSSYNLSRDPRNLNLKSSEAVHYVAGIEYLLAHDTRLNVEVYYKDMTNGFVDNDTSQVVHNEGLGYARGFEMTVQKKMSENFMGSVAYTWSQSKRQDHVNAPEYDFEYDRPHNVSMTGIWKISDTWQAGLKYQYASGNPYTPVIGSTKVYGEWFVVEGEHNFARFPDYHSLDLRIDRSFRFPNWTFNVYLEVWNVLNRENVLDYYYEIDNEGHIERNVVADFPMMPMLGFSAQF